MASRSPHHARRSSSARRRTTPATPSTPPSRARATPHASASARPVTPPPIILGCYPFLGPFTHQEQLQHRAGILALLEHSPEVTLPAHPLFVTEAEDLHVAMAALQNRGRAGSAHGRESVAYAVLYTDLIAAARRQIVAELRTHYQLPDSWLMALFSASLPPAAQSVRRRSPARRRGA